MSKAKKNVDPMQKRNTDAFAHDQQRDTPDGIMRQGMSDRDMRQPDERDQTPDGGKLGTDRRTDPDQKEIHGAHKDVERGLVDTERRGIPSNVPSRRRNRQP